MFTFSYSHLFSRPFSAEEIFTTSYPPPEDGIFVNCPTVSSWSDTRISGLLSASLVARIRNSQLSLLEWRDGKFLFQDSSKTVLSSSLSVWSLSMNSHLYLNAVNINGPLRSIPLVLLP